jgi:hypothetical protein
MNVITTKATGEWGCLERRKVKIHLPSMNFRTVGSVDRYMNHALLKNAHAIHRLYRMIGRDMH